MRRWHWALLRSVPQVYVWAWTRRRKFWLQIIKDPTQDPTAMYDELHRHAGPIPVEGLVPVVHAWLVGRNAHVREALRSDDLHVLSNRRLRLPLAVRWIEELIRPRDLRLHPLRPPSLNAIEGPDHRTVRNAVSGWFRPRAIQEMTDQIERETKVLLDTLERQLAHYGTVDVMAGFCRALPAIVIGSFFGLSADEVARLDYLRRFDAALTVLDVGLSWKEYRHNTAALVRLFDWVEGQMRDGPPEGLPRQLAKDETLTEDMRIVTSVLLLEAGFATTVVLLGNAIRLLLDHPEQLHILRRHPELWPNAIEEVLRLEAPLRYTTRVAVRDTTLAGQKIRKGQILVLDLAAAGRDPEVFPFPHYFYIERDNAEHLAFSAGRHFCVGPALARREALIALPMFFDRFPTMRLAARPVRANTQVMQRWAKLEVAL